MNGSLKVLLIQDSPGQETGHLFIFARNAVPISPLIAGKSRNELSNTEKKIIMIMPRKRFFFQTDMDQRKLYIVVEMSEGPSNGIGIAKVC